MTSRSDPNVAPLLSLNGTDLYHMIGSGFSRLKEHSHIVNALNVFPVPDGDTGANMVLTMQAAWNAAAAIVSAHAGQVMQALAHGAVRGARGNSGVILSQIFRGMAECLRDNETIDASLLAKAMEKGKDTAYKGVLKPVEGTILTVIREAAEAGSHAAAISPDLRFVFETMVHRAQQALAATPDLLPVLKQAGVVDAGGQGLCYLLEGMLDYLHGKPYIAPEKVSIVEEKATTPHPNLDFAEEEEWGYDIQYLIYGQELDEKSIREQLLAMGGESVVVGRAGNVIKVHVHSTDPGPFLSYGASLGQLDDIVLENMTLQTLRRRGEWRESEAVTRPIPPHTPPHQPPTESERECHGIVAVVSGEGMKQVFESLGACAIVTGGQTMNPSAEELLQAAESLPHENVILLPNNKNIIMAAKQAAALSEKRIYVLETRSMPQGVAAMLGFHPHANIEENLASMQAAAEEIHTAEVTTAVREARFDHVHVKPGDIIGLIDGRLCCAGQDLFSVLKEVLSRIDPDEMTELFTLYYGQPLSETEAQALVAQLEPHFPEHEFELMYGGQPHYHFLISAE
ncbi:MAG: DAK2 domain-containing protein [Chloroflexi bacterium]|nr:DAK2 domain-containing protein [Chloroflexota bacterium]